MIDLIKAAILGIIQGLTEFLPISSEGHLILTKRILNLGLFTDAHLDKSFDLALHGGTFIALVVYFREDVVRLLHAFWLSLRYGTKAKPERRLAVAIAIGTIPAAIAGVFGEKLIEEKLGAPALIALQLIVFALVLWLAERAGRKKRDISKVKSADGLVVGIAQVLALAPGVSRSGITMTAGLVRGMTRETAARFSFLLAIPIIGGSAVHGLLGLHKAGLGSMDIRIFVVGMLAALISGYLCIRFFLRYLQTRSFTPFVIYRIALGIVILSWLALHR